jgi:hypothetical protein
LVNQKDKDRRCKINQIMDEISGKKIFHINGSDDFKEQIYSNIRVLLEVKPGRILIKELATLNTLFSYESIPINSAERPFHHSKGSIDMNLNKCSDDNYNALSGTNQISCSKPKAILLAHELIHELHRREKEVQDMAKDHHLKYQRKKNYVIPNCFKNIDIYPNPTFKSLTFEGLEEELIFKKLSYLEEEHTVLGVNIPRYLNKKNISKLDVLSENVFLRI